MLAGAYTGVAYLTDTIGIEVEPGLEPLTRVTRCSAHGRC